MYDARDFVGFGRDVDQADAHAAGRGIAQVVEVTGVT